MLPACELSIGTRPRPADPTSTASNTVRIDGRARSSASGKSTLAPSSEKAPASPWYATTSIAPTIRSADGARRRLHAAIGASLRRLRTDSIGLYYLHRPDPHTPLEESRALIKEFRDRGKIRLAGVSQVTIEQIERAREVVPIAAVQNHYNLNERR